MQKHPYERIVFHQKVHMYYIVEEKSKLEEKEDFITYKPLY